MVARIGLKSAKPVRTYFKEWREWKGWTQQELADRMEITAATVSRIESGDRDWSKGYLEAFSHVIGCPEPSDPITRPPSMALSIYKKLEMLPQDDQEDLYGDFNAMIERRLERRKLSQ